MLTHYIPGQRNHNLLANLFNLANNRTAKVVLFTLQTNIFHHFFADYQERKTKNVPVVLSAHLWI